MGGTVSYHERPMRFFLTSTLDEFRDAVLYIVPKQWLSARKGGNQAQRQFQIPMCGTVPFETGVGSNQLSRFIQNSASGTVGHVPIADSA